MSWDALFARADGGVTLDDVRAALDRRRSGATGDDRGSDLAGDPAESSPARVVADADVLAADLLVGGPARDALDAVRAHSWVTLVASDALVDDAQAVVADLADADLAADWRDEIEELRDPVAHPVGDHPALASAYRGGAMHVLTFDDALQSPQAGAAIRGRVEVSARSPRAFAAVFDPESLYEAVEGGGYPGPDRDPRE
jgi:hypothetical protein